MAILTVWRFPLECVVRRQITDVVSDGAMHDAVPAIAALGVSPIVRLPDMQGWMVKRKPSPMSVCIPERIADMLPGALDSGAHGVRTIEW